MRCFRMIETGLQQKNQRSSENMHSIHNIYIFTLSNMYKRHDFMFVLFCALFRDTFYFCNLCWYDT